MKQHPDILDLELFRTGEASENVCEHVSRCPQCQAEVDRVSRLSARLAPADAPVAGIAPEIDQAVLAVIERRTSRRFRLTLAAARWLVPATAAALVLGGVAMLWRDGLSAPASAPKSAYDLNNDGAVDILDALTVARGLKDGAAQRAWDVNHDGRIDAADVDVVARRAVVLEQEDVKG